MHEGKSSVLNYLSNAGVFAANMLFATLDPTTRLVLFCTFFHDFPSLLFLWDQCRHHTFLQVQSRDQQLPDILMTDTVGFVQKLPTHLVAAFRATLGTSAIVIDIINTSDILISVIFFFIIIVRGNKGSRCIAACDGHHQWGHLTCYSCIFTHLQVLNRPGESKKQPF